MALSEVQTNNRLVKYRDDFIIEWWRGNRFSPYQGAEMTNIIRTVNDLKSGGEEVNIPMLSKSRSVGVGSGTLTGNEELLDDYGMRVRIDWARHAYAMRKSDRRKQSADAFGEVRPSAQRLGGRTPEGRNHHRPPRAALGKSAQDRPRQRSRRSGWRASATRTLPRRRKTPGLPIIRIGCCSAIPLPTMSVA